MTYVVVPNHMYGPSIIQGGTLVDTCPSLESAERMCAAFNELETESLSWALPLMQALPEREKDRVIRYLAKRVRYGS